MSMHPNGGPTDQGIPGTFGHAFGRRVQDAPKTMTDLSHPTEFSFPWGTRLLKDIVLPIVFFWSIVWFVLGFDSVTRAVFCLFCALVCNALYCLSCEAYAYRIHGPRGRAVPMDQRPHWQQQGRALDTTTPGTSQCTGTSEPRWLGLLLRALRRGRAGRAGREGARGAYGRCNAARPEGCRREPHLGAA